MKLLDSPSLSSLAQGEVSPAVDTSTPAADMKRRQQQQGLWRVEGEWEGVGVSAGMEGEG